MPDLYVIGGANGSGKTTASLQILPNILGVLEYVNADEIAAGLSPFNPESVVIQAGRLMLERLETLVNAEIDFAFETTLATRSFVRFLRKCKSKGYRINLIYFWLQSPELAIARVRRRVESGGHNIPEDTIRRRYQRGRKNLTDLYLPLCDRWIVYDNSSPNLQIIAERPFNQEAIIYQPQFWTQITTNNDE
ncbi:zeta toxin family protein [Limnoraphis robusta Tam1]|uniref:UDP-N-acetylglucosamine kinase n=1 Tax=Limnoraphis robusta CCNP1315 TaxID=3110306 RepID=A0ABU5U5Y7_9CYAN|nr:zeta toxin family protein [Limnoraphis robusta]MEA5498868.1 zeta toxin family protein [Limnoraphis robusta BA-68 BA1]MEA5522605.1 zeta toxin family protein [Limnoraphis robusta CCNP1315]MEA5541929.1 zeta toxin family protein [Limnoraphis robusta Tam1]MEA5546516.1 zeta toxin family protein [Limnoraphis robusta CCNP1324]